jgi:formylmethanofuran dehydrogenase subunit E
MGPFWCWLFGHKWFEVSDFLKERTTFHWTFVCSRCGEAVGNLDKSEEDK